MQNSVKATVAASVEHSVKSWASVAAAANGDTQSTDADGFTLVTGNQKSRRKQELKQALTELKKEDSENESRLANIIVYRAPEQDSKDAEVRTKKDAKIVTDLLNAIEVDAKPCKIFRVGRFDESKTGSRPHKVCFENQATTKLVMENTNKLQNASEDLKQLSVCYDLSEEERITVKTLVEQAKEK